MSGFGGRNVDYNLPGLPNSSISNLPYNGVAIFRERADQAEEFCMRLREKLAQYPHGHCKFENIDVSQVMWTPLSFSYLIGVIQEQGASTQRLKVYKAGLDDEGAQKISNWMNALPAQQMPSEIHLSHNRISATGLGYMLNVLGTKRASLQSRPSPIWLRVENNRIDKSTTDGYVAQGVILYASKIGDCLRSQNRVAVAAMPDMFRNGSANTNANGGVHVPALQNPMQTPPPAPPAVQPRQISSAYGTPAPAAVYPPAPVQQGWHGTQSLGYGPMQSVHPQPQHQHYGYQPPRPPPPAPQSNVIAPPPGVFTQPLVHNPNQQAYMAQQQRTASSLVQAAVQQPPPQELPGLSSIRPPRTLGGVPSTGAKPEALHTHPRARSRSPVPPKPPPKEDPKEDPLPPNWERHWSEEYKIPYWWNFVTDESVWEVPKA